MSSRKTVSPVKTLMEEPTISVDDAAMLLRLSRHHAYAAVKEGHIPSIRIGRCIRVPSAPLRAMLGLVEAAE
jgi:excisionase family DNA binding protein